MSLDLRWLWLLEVEGRGDTDLARDITPSKLDSGDRGLETTPPPANEEALCTARAEAMALRIVSPSLSDPEKREPEKADMLCSSSDGSPSQDEWYGESLAAVTDGEVMLPEAPVLLAVRLRELFLLEVLVWHTTGLLLERLLVVSMSPPGGGATMIAGGGLLNEWVASGVLM